MDFLIFNMLVDMPLNVSDSLTGGGVITLPGGSEHIKYQK